jgi:ribosomal-protein-alanine N-acetyltransferase
VSPLAAADVASENASAQAEPRLLQGARLRLARFTAADVTPRYLAWLNDPEVNRYSRRRDLPPSSAADARAYLQSLPDAAEVLAIATPEQGHVGNIRYDVDAANRRADISIMIGERDVWGRGIGAEAVYLVARHLLRERGLNRVDAGTCNPAFAALVLKLGWCQEGVMRQRVMLGGALHDYVILAQFASEFRPIPRFER